MKGGFARPPALPLSGHSLLMLRDPFAWMRRQMAARGERIRVRMGGTVYRLVVDPADVDWVLKTGHRHFSRAGGTAAEAMRTVTGDGLITNEGDAWRTHRRVVGRFFTRDAVAGFAPVIDAAVARILDAQADGAEVELTGMTERIASATIGGCLFGEALAGRETVFRIAMRGVLDHHWRRLRTPFHLMDRLPTRSRRRFERGLRVLDELVEDVIANDRRGCLVAHMLAARDGTAGFDDEAVRAETRTLLLAGQETVASSLAWAWLDLARAPTWQARAADDSAVRSACWKESLRLAPAVWLIERAVVEDHVHRGAEFSAGDLILISPYLTHRRAADWDAPEEFEPERFLGRPPPPSYLPFGIGPHACLGERLATAIADAATRRLLEKFRIEDREPDRPPKPRAGMTMRIAKGRRVRFGLS